MEGNSKVEDVVLVHEVGIRSWSGTWPYRTFFPTRFTNRTRPNFTKLLIHLFSFIRFLSSLHKSLFPLCRGVKPTQIVPGVVSGKSGIDVSLRYRIPLWAFLQRGGNDLFLRIYHSDARTVRNLLLWKCSCCLHV